MVNHSGSAVKKIKKRKRKLLKFKQGQTYTGVIDTVRPGHGYIAVFNEGGKPTHNQQGVLFYKNNLSPGLLAKHSEGTLKSTVVVCKLKPGRTGPMVDGLMYFAS